MAVDAADDSCFADLDFAAALAVAVCSAEVYLFAAPIGIAAVCSAAGSVCSFDSDFSAVDLADYLVAAVCFAGSVSLAADWLTVVLPMAAVHLIGVVADRRVAARSSFSSSSFSCLFYPSGQYDPDQLHFQNQEWYLFLLLLQTLLSQQVLFAAC